MMHEVPYAKFVNFEQEIIIDDLSTSMRHREQDECVKKRV